MALTKAQRLELRGMFGGRCAYCGCELPEKGWHKDHIEPVLRETIYVRSNGLTHGVKSGKPYHPERERPDNYFPACAPCNLFKGSFSVEQFRQEIRLQIERARRSSVNFRTAERFGMLEVVDRPVIFYFEMQANA